MSRSEPITSHDLRLVPAAGAAWLAAWLVTGEVWGWAACLAGLGVVGLLIAIRHRHWTVGLACLTMAGASAVAASQFLVLTQGLVAELADQRAIAEVTFTVTSDARAQGTPVRVTHIDVHGRAQRVRSPTLLVADPAWAESLAQIEVGGQGRALVLLTPARVGERQVARLKLRSPVDVVAQPPVLYRAITDLREGLRDAMRLSSPAPAGLVPALVVGDTSRLPGDVEEDFRATGLTHLTAVSGTNLTLLLAFAMGVARTIGLHGRPLRLLGLFVVGFFVVLCRAEPSVLRAAAMGLVAMAATGASSRSSGVRSLAVAVFALLLIDPWLARSWGFALSACASAGILVWGGPWQRAMRRWAPAWLAEAICIPLSAQLATQPLVTALSGAISVAGVAANATAGPFVGPVTVLGIVAALISPISATLASVVGVVAGWAVWPIIAIARFFAGLPAASWPWRASALSLVVLSAICLGLGLSMHWLLTRRLATLAFLAVIVLASWRQPPQPGWPGQWSMVACDVGQGEATVLRAGPGVGVLIDTGDEPRAVQQCLHSLGIKRLPIVVITHPHADHVGALPTVLRAFNVELLATSDVAGLERVLAATDEPSPPVTELLAGATFQVGDVSWRTLGPLPGAGPSYDVESDGESAAENDESVVAIAEVAGLRVLITGDVEASGQDAILRAGGDVSAHVVSLPHHGAANQSENFLRNTDAAVAVASVGERNAYGHPAASTVRLAEGLGMHLVRTDQSGSIAIALGQDGTLTVRRSH